MNIQNSHKFTIKSAIIQILPRSNIQGCVLGIYYKHFAYFLGRCGCNTNVTNFAQKS